MNEYFQIFTVSSEAGSLFVQSFAHHSGEMWTCSRIYLLLITNYYYFALVLRIRKSGRLNKAEKKGSKNCQKKHNARSHPVTRYPIRLVACHASKKEGGFLFFGRCIAWFPLRQPKQYALCQLLITVFGVKRKGIWTMPMQSYWNHSSIHRLRASPVMLLCTCP